MPATNRSSSSASATLPPGCGISRLEALENQRRKAQATRASLGGIIGSILGAMAGGLSIYSIVTVRYAEAPSDLPQWVAQTLAALLGAVFGGLGGGLGAAVVATYLPSLRAMRQAREDVSRHSSARLDRRPDGSGQ
jgi:hypothetical protein